MDRLFVVPALLVIWSVGSFMTENPSTISDSDFCFLASNHAVLVFYTLREEWMFCVGVFALCHETVESSRSTTSISRE
jgi:hypothetical protein